jgi:hypothetical protein
MAAAPRALPGRRRSTAGSAAWVAYRPATSSHRRLTLERGAGRRASSAGLWPPWCGWRPVRAGDLGGPGRRADARRRWDEVPSRRVAPGGRWHKLTAARPVPGAGQAPAGTSARAAKPQRASDRPTPAPERARAARNAVPAAGPRTAEHAARHEAEPAVDRHRPSKPPGAAAITRTLHIAVVRVMAAVAPAAHSHAPGLEKQPARAQREVSRPRRDSEEPYTARDAKAPTPTRSCREASR